MKISIILCVFLTFCCKKTQLVAQNVGEIAQFHGEIGARNPEEKLANNLEEVVKNDMIIYVEYVVDMIVDEYLDEDGFMLPSIKSSSALMKNLKFLRQSLKYLTPQLMGEQDRKTFFINIYNIMFINSIMEARGDYGISENNDFKYVIGNQAYTMNNIKYGILQVPTVNATHSRSNFTAEDLETLKVESDVRTSFSLFRGTKRGPSLRSYSARSLEDDLNAATIEACNKGTFEEKKSSSQSSIVIDSNLRRTHQEFKKEKLFLKWLTNCVRNQNLKVLLYFAAVENFAVQIKYQDFDDKITFSEEVGDVLKVGVDLFIQSMNSEVKDFLVNQVQPVYEELKNIVDLSIITFGKGSVKPRETEGTFRFQCENGPLECVGNKILSCAFEYLSERHRLPFAACVVNSASISTAVEECGKKVSVPTMAVTSCSNSKEGGEILYENGLKTLTLVPPLYYVPTVTFEQNYNSSLLQRSLTDFRGVVCDAYFEKASKARKSFPTPFGCPAKVDIFTDFQSEEAYRYLKNQIIPTWKRLTKSVNFQIFSIIADKTINNTEIAPSRSREFRSAVFTCLTKLAPVDAQMAVIECLLFDESSRLRIRECLRMGSLNFEVMKGCWDGPLWRSVMQENNELLGQILTASSPFYVVINKNFNSAIKDISKTNLLNKICESYYDYSRPYVSPSGCPIIVETYIESLCPDTKRFLTKILRPTWQEIGALMELRFISFGKANVWKNASGSYEFECQHGPKECQGNIGLSCSVRHLSSVTSQLEMIICIMESNNPAKAALWCAQRLNLPWSQIQQCLESKEGSFLLYENGLKTMKLEPPLYFVPTVTLNKAYNGEQLEVSLTNLKEQVCQMYQKGSREKASPKGCRLKLDVFLVISSPTTVEYVRNQLVPVWEELSDVIELELHPLIADPNSVGTSIMFEEICKLSSSNCQKETTEVCCKTNSNCGLEVVQNCCQSIPNCELEIALSCVIKISTTDIQMKFLSCILEGNGANLESARNCAQSFGLLHKEFINCLRKDREQIVGENHHLNLSMKKALGVRPSISSFPALLINQHYDKELLVDQKSHLKEIICRSFYDPTVGDSKTWRPDGCALPAEIYIESLCPDTSRFFRDQLQPNWPKIRSFVDLKLIPFGKATAKVVDFETGNIEFECQHGALECYGNKVMSCIVDLLHIDAQVEVLSCMMSRKYPATEGEECVSSLGYKWDPILKCIEERGSQLLYENGIRTQSLKPSLHFVPGVTINGIYQRKNWREPLDGFRNLLCSKYLVNAKPGKPVPYGCKMEVKIFFHDLDFEMKLFFSQELEEFWRIFKRIATVQFFPLKSPSIGNSGSRCSGQRCFSLNMIACLNHLLSADDGEMQINFISCFMDLENTANADTQCLHNLDFGQKKVEFCTKSRESAKLLQENQENFSRIWNSDSKGISVAVENESVSSVYNLGKRVCEKFFGLKPTECGNIN